MGYDGFSSTGTGDAFGTVAVTEVSDPYELINKDAKLAVIISGNTASSGEAVAISLIGRTNTRFFGEPTCGVSTANQRFELDNGNAFFLTTAVMADRSKRQYAAGIEPDESFTGSLELQERVIQWFHDQ